MIGCVVECSGLELKLQITLLNFPLFLHIIGHGSQNNMRKCFVFYDRLRRRIVLIVAQNLT